MINKANDKEEYVRGKPAVAITSLQYTVQVQM